MPFVVCFNVDVCNIAIHLQLENAAEHTIFKISRLEVEFLRRHDILRSTSSGDVAKVV